MAHETGSTDFPKQTALVKEVDPVELAMQADLVWAWEAWAAAILKVPAVELIAVTLQFFAARKSAAT
ncbi:hypothetical protein T439DRAFT_324835 [Meredithblackwellia eburnea MCA 4105]